MLRALNRERSGASTFEWTLTLPFTIILVGFMFYMTFLLLSWASYGSLASNLAKDLNMRSIGLTEAKEWVNAHPNNRIESKDGRVFTLDQVSPGRSDVESAYRNVIAYQIANHSRLGGSGNMATNDYANQIFFPYTSCKNIKLLISEVKNGVAVPVDKNGNLSNCVATVEISYEYCPFSLWGKYGEPGSLSLFKVPMKATGYGIIS
jgi:hypothetical protein